MCAPPDECPHSTTFKGDPLPYLSEAMFLYIHSRSNCMSSAPVDMDTRVFLHTQPIFASTSVHRQQDQGNGLTCGICTLRYELVVRNHCHDSLQGKVDSDIGPVLLDGTTRFRFGNLLPTDLPCEHSDKQIWGSRTFSLQSFAPEKNPPPL